MATEHVLDGVLAHAGTTAGLIAARASRLRPVHPATRTTAIALLVGALGLHGVNGVLVFAGELDPRLALEIVATTAWGRSLLVLAVGSLIVAGSLRSRHASVTHAGSAVAVLGLVWLGHGASEGEISSRAVLHAAHLAAAIGWCAGVLGFTLEVGAGGRPAHALAAFARLALVYAAVVVVTGLALTGRYLPDPAGLATPYGVALAGKVAIVAAVGVAALANRRSLGALDAEPGWQRLEQGLFAEFSLFAVVLGAAAILTELEPP